MNITLEKPDLEKFLEDQIKAGRFDSAEDLVAAAVARLQFDVSEGEFDPGELEALVAEGEADIRRGDVIDSGEAFRLLREWTADQRKRAQD
jgi:Arc/MetJ-type ribon-helix-helix transcriptional regulator